MTLCSSGYSSGKKSLCLYIQTRNSHKHQSPFSLIRQAPPQLYQWDQESKMAPVFWVIWRLVIICLHLGSINSLFLFCFKHCNIVLESASGQNLCQKKSFIKVVNCQMWQLTPYLSLLHLLGSLWWNLKVSLGTRETASLNKHWASRSLLSILYCTSHISFYFLFLILHRTDSLLTWLLHSLHYIASHELTYCWRMNVTLC